MTFETNDNLLQQLVTNSTDSTYSNKLVLFSLFQCINNNVHKVVEFVYEYNFVLICYLYTCTLSGCFNAVVIIDKTL